MTKIKIPKNIIYKILKIPIPIKKSQIKKTINKKNNNPNLT